MEIITKNVKLPVRSDLRIWQLPTMSALSKKKGPVVWLTAGIHGDEVGGVVVIQEIFKRLRTNNLKAGTLNAFVLMNPFGFEMGTRQVPFTEEDLNRSFPGTIDGTLAERIGNLVYSTIKESKPTAVLDLHNDWTNSIPYTLIDPKPQKTSQNIYHLTEQLAQKAGLPVILDNTEFVGTLSYNCLNDDIASISLELGESYVVNEKNITLGVNTIWNILSHLKMVDAKEIPATTSLINQTLLYSNKPLTSSVGIVRFLVKPGQKVKAGTPIARIYSVYGKLEETLKAQKDALVLGHADQSVAFPGTPIISLGQY
jgi:uncharacterized protein